MRSWCANIVGIPLSALKMKEISDEIAIFYNFYGHKCCLGPSKFALHIVKVYYRMARLRWFCRFHSRNIDKKILFTAIDQVWKKLTNFLQKLSKADMSSRNVVRKLNIYHQTFKPFEGSWLQKKNTTVGRYTSSCVIIYLVIDCRKLLFHLQHSSCNEI